MSCKGICQRIKAKRRKGMGFYLNGAKRCTKCCEYIIWNEGRQCPCCGMTLRTKTRSPMWKRVSWFGVERAEPKRIA